MFKKISLIFVLLFLMNCGFTPIHNIQNKNDISIKNLVFNGDQTPMEWVISILIQTFKHTQTKAQELTLAIHSDGSAIVGIYSYEIAEQKSVEATMLSRNNGFPLAFKLEVE